MKLTPPTRCLCCTQTLDSPGKPVDETRAERIWSLLQALGYTREALLTTYREHIDYQAPGLAAWLENNP